MPPAWVTVAVEGDTDVPVVAKILKLAGHELDRVHGRAGKARLDLQLPGYNNAAHHAPWLVLRDLDTDAPCAGALITALLPSPAARMRLRIAVHALEAWLLADAQAVSRYFAVPLTVVPALPESLPDPKRSLVDLARRSRSTAVRQDMVPALGMTARVGPGYSSRVIEFARDHWRPRVASQTAPSLRSCIAALRTLA